MANINIHDLEQVDSELNNFEPQELTSIEIALINGGDGGKGKRKGNRKYLGSNLPDESDLLALASLGLLLGLLDG